MAQIALGLPGDPKQNLEGNLNRRRLLEDVDGFFKWVVAFWEGNVNRRRLLEDVYGFWENITTPPILVHLRFGLF